MVTYLVSQEVVAQSEDGGTLIALEDPPLPLDDGLLNLAGAGVKLVNLGGAEALRCRE